jgi:hypothetical protein
MHLIDRERGREGAAQRVGEVFGRTGGRRGAGDAMKRFGCGLTART